MSELRPKHATTQVDTGTPRKLPRRPEPAEQVAERYRKHIARLTAAGGRKITVRLDAAALADLASLVERIGDQSSAIALALRIAVRDGESSKKSRGASGYENEFKLTLHAHRLG